jgi:transposase-like protein
MGAVEIRQPRVSDVPQQVAPFKSEIVGKYERRSRTQARLLARLYLEGLATGDFEPVFRALVGETAALSPSSILRLKQEWEDECRLWRSCPITERYVYIFADGLVRHEAPCNPVGCKDPPSACRSRSWKLEAA